MAKETTTKLSLGLLRGICLIFLLHVDTSQGQDTSLQYGSRMFQIAKDPDETPNILAGETSNVTFTVFYVNTEGEFIITLVPKDEEYFTVTFEQLHGVSREHNGMNGMMDVAITGTKLGISEFDLVAINEETGDGYRIQTNYVKVRRVISSATLIVRYSVNAASVISLWLIEITTDIRIIFKILKRPYGVCIGMFCQFVIMPFLAWLLNKIFQIDGPASIGLILDGSCPGGTNSNFLSVLLEVDHVLSITMTFLSSIMALGMMPLNLYIYGRAYIIAGQELVTPFGDIMKQLAIFVVPVSIGVFIGYKWPKARDLVDKYIKPVALFAVVGLLCVDLPFSLYIFDSPWTYYAAAIIFPFLGGLAGFTLSKVARLTTRRSLTVAIETGVQNALIASTVLFYLYPQPEADLAIRLPYLIVLFTMFDGMLCVAVYTLLKRFYWHGVPYDNEEDEKDTTGLGEDGKYTGSDNEETKTAESSHGVPTISSDVYQNRRMDQGPLESAE